MCPEQVTITSDDLEIAPNSVVNLASIFYFVSVLHSQYREYTFDDKAKNILKRAFDCDGAYSREANKHCDYFLS